MGRMHEVDEQTFSDKVPGSSPAAADRERFLKPNLTRKNMTEHAIGVELTKTIQSVFQAATSHDLHVLHTPPHKIRGCLGQRSDAFNRVGIYLDNETARRATTLPAADGAKKKFTRKQVESGDFGRHSWHWMAVLGVVKCFHNPKCAFDMGHASSTVSSDSPSEEEDSDWMASDDDIEEAQPLSVPDAFLDSMDDEDSSSYTSSDDSDSEPYASSTGTPKEAAVSELVDFMHTLFALQHRTFVYGFYVQWRRARLLYVDRAGILVSEPFDWTKTSSPLHDFVWKLAHTTPEQRGYDPTVREASYAEMSEVLAAAKAKSLPAAIQPYIKRAFLSNDEQADADEVPIYKLTVNSSDPSPGDLFPDSEPDPPVTGMYSPKTSEWTFLVGRPHFVADSLVGRCTRGYVAWDMSQERFCFLKDSWRPLVPGRARPEHIVYERLHRHGVQRITTLVCGGDVGGPLRQRTHTHDHLPKDKRPVPRVHYRIVTQQVGVPLTEFATFGELARVFLDAVAAHYMAWKMAGILHRDVSVGNIIIDPITRIGYLIDWDLSRLRSELEDGPVEPDRTGTWQFQSALSLAYPRKPYRLSDDIESFIHTYRWLVLRYHETAETDLCRFVESEFESRAYSVIPGVHLGGEFKMRSFAADRSVFRVVDNDDLQSLLDKLAVNCFAHYRLVDRELMSSRYGVPQPSSQAEKIPEPQSAPTATAPTAGGRHADILKEMKRKRLVPPIPPLRLREGAHTKSDACDIVGPLSHHGLLVDVFERGVGNVAPRGNDQFRARFAQVPFRR